MDENKNEPVGRISDLILTHKQGKRLLVNAFDIAMIRELDEGAELTLKVPVAGSQYSSDSKEGVKVKVQESFDTIAGMRAVLK